MQIVFFISFGTSRPILIDFRAIPFGQLLEGVCGHADYICIKGVGGGGGLSGTGSLVFLCTLFPKATFKSFNLDIWCIKHVASVHVHHGVNNC